jgi:16S rRNA (uracil1498-N3)-methyltransferase
MTAALEQSGGAWLPSVFPECEVALALTALPQGDRLLLDPRSDTAFPRRLPAATVIAIGPEGGLEEKEIAQIHAVGFNSVSLGSTVLRFETAALAALVLARAAFAVGDND